MHRARVSTVAGKKAFAEGKWLTVIGNRSVHSGDWVWTDGHCIYGHESASGGAPVIVASGEQGIPLCIGRSHYIYQKEKLRLLSMGALSGGILYCGAHAAQLFLDAAYANGELLLDADMDANGNVFTLTGAHWREGTYLEKSETRISSNFQGAVRVEKNRQEIASFNLIPYYKAAKQPQFTGISVGGGYTDCKGHWGFYLEIDAVAENKNITEETSSMYYIEPDGVHRLFYTKGRIGGGQPARKLENFAGTGAKKFPIQDGYYYMWKSYMAAPPWMVRLPHVAMLTIFTPDGNPVITDYFAVGTRFAILHIGEGRHLLGVDPQPIQTYYLISSIGVEHPTNWEPEFVPSGIYLCADGTLQKLDRGECNTYRLRRVKNVKAWEKTLKSILQGGTV